MQAAVASPERKRVPLPLVTAVLTVAIWAAHIAIRETASTLDDPRDLVALMLVAYAGGLLWAWRRY